MRAGIFDRIIITNDGSDDDTEKLLKDFMQTGEIPEDKFTILGKQGKRHNQGKMGRFFEVLNFARDRLHLGSLITSDADMTNVGGNAFDLLGQENTDMPMRVSHVGEGGLNDEDIFGPKTSGVRSVNIDKTRHALCSHGVWKYDYIRRGFGLELLLNRILPYTMVQKRGDKENIPVFLPPQRRDRTKQIEELVRTESWLEKKGLTKDRRIVINI